MEILRRIRRALLEDFLAVVPGSAYPLTPEALLRLLYYAGFALFTTLLILSAAERGFMKSPERGLPEPSEQILDMKQI